MNALDKAISFFSPGTGLRRARARQALGVISKLAYEGANVGRRTSGWNAAGSSANAEIGVSLTKLRDRARQLHRDNPHARKAVSEWSGTAVGTGITGRSKTGDTALDATVDTLWEEFCEVCDADGQLDFNGLQALVAETVFLSGEALVRRRKRFPEDGFTVPLQLQVLEGDYLDHEKTTSLPNGGVIIHGVEFDPIGRRVAYWLFDQHPGEVSGKTFLRGGFQSKRVPATEILHIYEKQRPGQVRGVSAFAPVLMQMRDLDEFEEAQLVAKKIAACFAVFVEQPEGADGAGIGVAGTDDAGKRTDTLEPGMIEYTRPGEKVTFGTPPTSNGDRDYVFGRLSTIAAGLRMPAYRLSGDYSQINYSSFKAGDMGFRNAIDQFRWLTLIPMFLQPAWQWFVEAAQAAGELPKAEDIYVDWAPPQYATVDPEKDARATLMELRMKTKSLQQACAERGVNFTALLEDHQQADSALDAAGVISDADPRKVSQTGVWQQTDPATAAPNGGSNAGKA